MKAKQAVPPRGETKAIFQVPATYESLGGAAGRRRFVYDLSPMLVYWEATLACDLACSHCRAEAQPWRDPLELSPQEARKLIDQIASFSRDHPPHLVITGGDPLQRPDLFQLIATAKRLGLGVSVTPAGTPRLTAKVIEQLKAAGVDSLAMSLDGSTAEKHDELRGVKGSFDLTLRAMREVVSRGVPLQVNTMVTAQTIRDLWHIYDLLKRIRIARWALFFLIRTGRGGALSEVTAADAERLLNRLAHLLISEDAPFPIKTTEAHHFRRIAHLRMKKAGMSDEAIAATPVGRAYGIRDGNGIVFVSHQGEVFPSGFLPLSAGNVRSQSLVDIYRTSALFRKIRDTGLLMGKCGVCEYREICGGSRARAYATYGSPLESDPLCVYEPKASKGTKSAASP